MSTVRSEILAFLHDPRTFAAGLPAERADLWRRGLTEFVRPRLARPGATPLMPSQVAAWDGLAPHRVGLLLGPPGTGKTHLLAWMAMGYIQSCRTANLPCRVLATGFTRESMANLLNKIAELAAAEASGTSLTFFGTPPDSTLDRLVVTHGLKGGAGVRAGWQFLGRQKHSVVAATNWSLGKLFRSVDRPNHPGLAADGHTARLFDLVLIDEASQTLVSQGLMSLAGLAEDARVIVCGDDRQLAPVRTTSEASVGGRELGGSLYRFLASAGVAEFALEDTFRLNAPLVEFPAREFYSGHRFASAVPDRRLVLRDDWRIGLTNWERLALDPEFPIVVLLHDGPPAATENAFERDLIVHLVERLATRLPPRPGSLEPDETTLWGKRLAVVTPHRSQNAAIRTSLSRIPLCERPRVETVDKVQGHERDVIIVGYGVSDPEFAQSEAAFLFDPCRLNVAITRPKGKLILVVSRGLFDASPSSDADFEAADVLRRFVHECVPAGKRDFPGPNGGQYAVEFRVRGFNGNLPSPLPAEPAARELPVIRLTYPGTPLTDAEIREFCKPFWGNGHLYVTATSAIADERRQLAHSTQAKPNEGSAVRFDLLLRHLMTGPVLSPSHQRVFLQRGIRAAEKIPEVAERLLHDVPAWLEALNELEARGEDVTAGVRPELMEELTSPVLGPVLVALQKACRDARKDAPPPFEEAARRFLDNEFQPPPLVVMEGFTYLVPLQSHFVRRCLGNGSRVVFIHPQNSAQPDAFAIMERTYSAYSGQTVRAELATAFDSPPDLGLLQAGLFAETSVTPVNDGSVTIRAFTHRHREIAACLERIRDHLATPGPDGELPPAGSVAIVSRNSGEFLTIIQEEARRLGLQDRLRIEPRLLLLTPLGRFALTLYELSPGGILEVSPDQFETMIASGWLGSKVQRTVESFAAVRAQMFDRCRTPTEWKASFARLVISNEPDLARLPGSAVPIGDRESWQTAFAQVETLHQRLFDGTTKSVTGHIKRLQEELARLNPDDLRQDERALVQRIIEALEEVVGSDAVQLDDREMGDLMSGMARGEPAPDDAPDRSKVWVASPESVDCSPRDVVFYLGLDSSRVPRPAVMPWPFFNLDPDLDADRERYLFLAVTRAAKKELHLSYSRQGEDEVYEPSPYLLRAARLLGREDDLKSPEPDPPATPSSRMPLPVLGGKVDELLLYDVAVFGLCPYRFRLERFDSSARRFREKFQLRFVALGVWMDRTFEGLVGKGPFKDPVSFQRALHESARHARGNVAGLFPAFQPEASASMDWESIRRQLHSAFEQVVDWLNEPNNNGKTKIGFGVTIERAPAGTDFSVNVGDRSVVVGTGLRHVVRAGLFPYAMPNALTFQHWLLPAYRNDSGDVGDSDPIDGIEIFPGLRQAVIWWTAGIRASLAKNSDRDDIRQSYRRYQADIAERVQTIEAGKFPKHPGDHCELCPVRHTCLGIPHS